jgi:hypothetical protein
MIAFRDRVPPIVLANGRAIAFDRDWLVRALNVAAQRAGYVKWWLAPHVAESLHTWMEGLHDISVMPVAQFTRAVRAALQVIGYAEVGERFEASSPFSRISLVEVARDAGNGFELAFFGALETRLREVLELGGTYCELVGMEACVKLLSHRKSWCRECDALREEIVLFAREKTGRACRDEGGQRELFLHVA